MAESYVRKQEQEGNDTDGPLTDPFTDFEVLGDSSSRSARTTASESTRWYVAVNGRRGSLKKLRELSEAGAETSAETFVALVPDEADLKVPNGWTLRRHADRAPWLDAIADAVLSCEAGPSDRPAVLLVPRAQDEHPARTDFDYLREILMSRGAGLVSDGLPVSLDRPEILRTVDAVRTAVSDPLLDPDEGSLSTYGRELLVADDSGGYRVSRLADLLELAARTRPSIVPYAAMADLLRRRGHRQDADKLEGLVQHWVDQRLWSLNCVPELVAHDDRHVERVDHLATQLAAPLLDNRSVDPLTPDDLLALSASAWLHDWGHVGGCLPGSNTHIEEPREVRRLHGLLTDGLLTSPFYEHMHGLDHDTAVVVGALCAHHQSWTSFGGGQDMDSESAALFMEITEDRPESFRDAISRCLPAHSASTYRRYQGLLALLRVADAADVGAHRVPDHTARKSFEEMRLARFRNQTLAMLDTSNLDRDLKGQIGDAIRSLSWEPARFDERIVEHLTRIPSGHRLRAQLERLVGYVELIRAQLEYQKHHRRVAVVNFVTWRANGYNEFTVSVVTRPGEDAGAALESVHADIERELHGGDLGDTVADALDRIGLRYREPA